MRLAIRPPAIKLPEETFRISKEFQTRGEVTKRALDISEAFGIGVDEAKTFTIFKDFEVEINPGDVVYITGVSGGGKSVLLRELIEEMGRHKEFGNVITDAEVLKTIKPNEILIDGVGKDTKEAVEILSMAGLNEAFLMLRCYKELSDGQKHRYRAAKMISSGADVWALDDFTSMLDRTTAKVVAYTAQKAARRQGKTLIVATTHEDLVKDLVPDIWTHKGFGLDVVEKAVPYRLGPCSVLRDVVIEEGSMEDYKRLEQFHYRARRPFSVKRVFRAVLEGKVIGAIVYGVPYLYIRARHVVLPQFKVRGSIREHCDLINRNFVRIWRVVVHPLYRSIGLGVKLVKETLPSLNVPYVEALAVMARYNPFLEHAEMLRVPEELYLNYDKGYVKALKRLKELGFSLELLASKEHNVRVLKGLKEEDLMEVKRLVHAHFTTEKFHRPSLGKKVIAGYKKAIAEALSLYRLPYSYFIWKNPSFPAHPEPQIPP